MADETPTLSLESAQVGDKGWTDGWLLDANGLPITDLSLPTRYWTALAAALDPATTARLFDQRDAAIERAKIAEAEKVRAFATAKNACDEAIALGEAQLRALDARDAALAEIERLRPVVEAAQAWHAIHALDHEGWHRTGCLRPSCHLAAAVDVYNQTPSPTPKGDA